MENRQLDWRGKSINGATPTVIGSVVVRPANSKRIGATFVNISVSQLFIIKGDIGVVNTGIPLNAGGGAYEINLTNPYYGPISVACAAAGEILAWTEDE